MRASSSTAPQVTETRPMPSAALTPVGVGSPGVVTCTAVAGRLLFPAASKATIV